MKKYSRLRAVIDLDAVMYNMEMMHANNIYLSTIR